MNRNSALIQEFLRIKRFALIGVSRNRHDFSRRLFRDLSVRGYDVIPVNPGVPIMEQRRCFSSIREVSPPVTAALLMTPLTLIEPMVRECIDAGVGLIWFYGTSKRRNIPPHVLEMIQHHSIKAIPGYCPYMFVPHPGFIHDFHGSLLKVLHQYPT